MKLFCGLLHHPGFPVTFDLKLSSVVFGHSVGAVTFNDHTLWLVKFVVGGPAWATGS